VHEYSALLRAQFDVKIALRKYGRKLWHIESVKKIWQHDRTVSVVFGNVGNDDAIL